VKLARAHGSSPRKLLEEEEGAGNLTAGRAGRRELRTRPTTRLKSGGGVTSTMRRLRSEEVNLEVGRAAASTGEGCTPFYMGEGVGRWPIKAAVQPTPLNGAREWSLDGEGETVGRGGDRVVAPFHFATGGEGTGWLSVRVSSDLSEAGGGSTRIILWRKGTSGAGPLWAAWAEKPLRLVRERNKKKIKRLAGLLENCGRKAIWAGQRK
jgi:hypothetical protein